MKVLIVDDEAFLAELVKLALEADGHASFSVGGVEQATELLQSVQVDMVLVDFAAAGGDPVPWLDDTILAHPELHGRIFILSDRKLMDDEAEGLRAHGARALDKPVTLHQMLETVRAIAPAPGRPPERRSGGPSIEL